MKIICDLCVSNLEYAGLSAAKNRAKRSQIGVINCGPQQLALVVQNADNKTGARYKLTGNVAQTFERFVSEGKCTIRLKNPHVDLIISKCDTLQLSLFIKTVKTGVLASNVSGESQSCGKSGKRLLESLPTTQKKLKVSDLYEKSRTKLSILSRKELATTSFIQTLVDLKLAGLSLSEIPPSVGKLARLKILDLSGNLLCKLPSTFAAKLVELNLSNNEFFKSTQKTWRFLTLPNIKGSLQSLDISSNKLPALPLEIMKLDILTSLNVSNNEIKKFPPSFGLLKRLRNLNISRNKIVAIDTSFQMLKLASINVIEAFYPPSFEDSGVIKDSFLSLRSLVSAFIMERRIQYKTLPVTVQDDMLLMRRCRCLKVVAHTKEQRFFFDANEIAQTCISDGDKYVRMHYSVCKDCLKRNK